MPSTCFSYPADVPPGAAQATPRRMPYSCFNYPADVPRTMPLPCFSYPYMCFSYPSDVPPDTTNRNAAQPDRLGLRRMPDSTCFRY